MLPSKKFHPFELDTFGLGALLRAAAAKGARRCVVGIGGSATNDGGFGIARALGWRFLDREGVQISRWTGLNELHEISLPRQRRWFRELLVAVDVQNPLLGRRGATRVYGPQKGVRPEDMAAAERCLGRLARVAAKHFGRDFARRPGAGAAGGLGFGLRAFANGRLTPGFDLFARRAALDEHLHRADLVITGEGAIDHSTLMGKGAGRIAESCRRLKLPCIGLAGTADLPVRNQRSFVQVHALTDLTTLTQAKARATYWLERMAERAARQWPPR
jgi:glycerate kinase